MILSTQISNFPKGSELIGCGIDIEEPKRFSKWVGSPPTFIFSKNEIDRFSASKNPIEQMSASFSLKEALYKALEKPYNFPECQLAQFSFDTPLILNFSDNFKREYTVSFAEYRINRTKMGEIVVELSLFR